MPPTLPQTISLASVISSVIAPVGLISTTAILLSGYTSKYSSISDQMRRMTNEFRLESTGQDRRTNLQKQLRLYHQRISAMWAASTLLSLALLAFVVTVLAVLFSMRKTPFGPVGIGTLLVGLIFIAAAISLELYEISLARLTVAGELADVFPDASSS